MFNTFTRNLKSATFALQKRICLHRNFAKKKKKLAKMKKKHHMYDHNFPIWLFEYP